MSKAIFSWDLFYRVPIIGIIRGFSLDEIRNILPVYEASGLNTIEITMNTKKATQIIKFIRDQYPKLNTGAGTVCGEKDLALALDAGAQFIVTPIIDKKVIRSCVKKKIPVFAGAFTPTEIHYAWTLGASMVKVYPAKSLGPGYIRDVKGPLDKVKLLPTGGMGLEDLDAYRQAGADGFGIGSPLFNRNLVEGKNDNGLLEHFRKFVAKVNVNS